MTKKKKLVKNALEHPELFSPAELAYFQLWLKKRKERKQNKDGIPSTVPEGT
jgi:hypothetical protein